MCSWNLRNIISIAIIFLFTACTTIIPRDEHAVSKGGVPYIRHINPPYSTPCGFLHWNGGCWSQWVDGSQHVYITDIAPPHVISHEDAHVDGMRHGAWNSLGCAIVYQGDSSGKYQAGDKICITTRGEDVIRKEKGPDR